MHARVSSLQYMYTYMIVHVDDCSNVHVITCKCTGKCMDMYMYMYVVQSDVS